MEIPGGRYRGLVGIGGSRGTPSASSVSLAGMDRSASQVDLKAKEEEDEEDKVKDNKDAKGATKKGPKVKAARIWAYSEPEYPVLAFGGFIALANGCVFPSIAFVFAEMLALFYSHDTDYIMDTAYMLGGIFFAIAVISWCLTGIQGGVFAVIGEKLTTRLRVHLFRAILRQDVAFFDDPDNSVGALTATFAPTRQLSELQRVRVWAPHSKHSAPSASVSRSQWRPAGNTASCSWPLSPS